MSAPTPTPAPLAAADLAAIRARLDAATPGPWEFVDYNREHPERDTWLGILRGAVEVISERFQVARVKYSALPHRENVANADLIAHAPSDLRALLAALARVTAERDALTAPGDGMVRVFRDGDQWCALVGQDLQDGHAGFGPTPADAVTDLGGNLWGSPWPEHATSTPEGATDGTR